MKRIISFALGLITCLHATIHVATSQKTFELLAKEIGQEQIQVHLLSPSAQGSHLFQLLPSDNNDLEQADLIISSAALEPLLKKYSTKVIAAHAHHHHHHHHHQDSPCCHHHALNHEWLSLKYTKQLAKELARRLASLDETHSTLYESRAQSLIESLSNIQKKYTGRASVPGLFYHESFSHLAHECKLSLGPALFSCEESQISIQVLQDIKKNQHHYKFLFAEITDSPESVRKVAQQIELPVTLLDTQGSQSQDLNHFFENILSKLTQEPEDNL